MSINHDKDPKMFHNDGTCYLYVMAAGLEAFEMFRFSSSFTIFFESI